MSTFKILVYIYINHENPASAYSEIVCVFEQPNTDMLICKNELPHAILCNFLLKAEIRKCSTTDYLSNSTKALSKRERKNHTLEKLKGMNGPCPQISGTVTFPLGYARYPLKTG